MMPFPGGLQDHSNGTLILSVALSIVYLYALGRPPSLRRTAAKAGSVLLLALLVWLQEGPALLALALLLGAAGDAFLAQGSGERAFLGGLASFLASHVAYVALFWSEGQGLSLLAAEPWRWAVGAVIVLCLVLLMARLLPGVGRPLRGPVIAYGLAIAAMGLTALTVAGIGAIAGAILFKASDALLAIGRFLVPAGSPHEAWMRPAVWVLYYLAQLVLTLTFLL